MSKKLTVLAFIAFLLSMPTRATETESIQSEPGMIEMIIEMFATTMQPPP